MVKDKLWTGWFFATVFLSLTVFGVLLYFAHELLAWLPDRVFVIVVLAVDVVMVNVLYYKLFFLDPDRVGESKSPREECSTFHSRADRFCRMYLTFCHLMLPLELCYATCLSQAPLLQGLAVFLLLGIHVQWLHRSYKQGIPYFGCADTDGGSACVMEDYGAGIPKCLRGGPGEVRQIWLFNMTIFSLSIVITVVGVVRLINAL